MTTKEKIEVMVAYAEGKKIQVREIGAKHWSNWILSLEPDWNWFSCEYRIKPEDKYRPYKDTAELKADFFKDCPQMGKRHRPAIWVVSAWGSEFQIEGFDGEGKWVSILGERYLMKELFENFKYLDGSPCGIKEE